MKESDLHEAALAYLGKQAASAAQLKRVLERRVRRRKEDLEEAAPIIERIIERFRGNGLLDDVKYAVNKAASLSRSGRSRRAISAHLQQKGIAQETVRASLPTDDLVSAITFARKRRVGPFARDIDEGETRDEAYARKRKALGAMARAGFSFDVCDRVLRMDLEEALERLHHS